MKTRNGGRKALCVKCHHPKKAHRLIELMIGNHYGACVMCDCRCYQSGDKAVWET